MRHSNPYRINNPDDIFEVSENSSHPELDDARRIYRLGGYTFQSATELQKFMEAEGLNPRNYAIEPVMEREFSKNMIIVNVVEKFKSRNQRALKRLEFG